MKLVLVLLDACRYDYISKDTTPFLYKLSIDNKYYISGDNLVHGSIEGAAISGLKVAEELKKDLS